MKFNKIGGISWKPTEGR